MKKLSASLAILAAVGAFMSFGVFSLFSSTQTNSSSLAAATFSLDQLPSAGGLLDSVLSLIPGDTITRCVQLTNSGSAPFDVTAKPSMSDISTGTLSSVATMTLQKVSNVDTGAGSDAIKACTPTSGHVVTVVGSPIIDHVAGGSLANATLTGAGTGGQWDADETHVYQVIVTLPTSVTSFATYGGKSLTANLNFQADQIAGAAK